MTRSSRALLPTLGQPLASWLLPVSRTWAHRVNAASRCRSSLSWMRWWPPTRRRCSLQRVNAVARSPCPSPAPRARRASAPLSRRAAARCTPYTAQQVRMRCGTAQTAASSPLPAWPAAVVSHSARRIRLPRKPWTPWHSRRTVTPRPPAPCWTPQRTSSERAPRAIRPLLPPARGYRPCAHT